MSQYADKKCKPCEGGQNPMNSEEIEAGLTSLESWNFNEGCLERNVTFKNYYETTSFVNAVIWVAHHEDHHPDIAFGYKTCKIRYSTHAVGGISENDFICAAKINALLG